MKPTRAVITLLAFLDGLPHGATVTSDSWRTEADAAQLSTAERGAAPGVAARLGYLEPLAFRDHTGQPVLVGNKPVMGCVPSDREHGKAGHVMVWTRTSLPVPDHLCELASEAARADAS